MDRVKLLLIAAIIVSGLVLSSGFSIASLVYAPNSYGLSARGIALSNALAGDKRDLSLCFYNPAGLAFGQSHGFGISYIYTMPDLEGGLIDGQKIKEKVNNRIVSVNIRSNLRKLFSESLRVPPLGFGLSLSIDDNFSTMMVFDDMRTYKGEFYRYGMSNLSLQSAIGIGITEWMSFGFGFHGGFKGTGIVTTKADVTGPTASEGTRMRGAFSPRPLFGVFFQGEQWGLGLTYREETMGVFEPIDVNATPSIAGVILPTMHIPMNFLDTFIPRDITLGVNWGVTRDLALMADLSWRNWERYDDVAADSTYVGSMATFDTVDIWTPRFGIEGFPLDDLALRGGYRYEQTPFRIIGTRFPEGGYSVKGKVILDSDTHVTSFGLGYNFNAREVLTVDFLLDATYQLHVLVPREAESSDGYTYESEGVLHLLTTSFEIRF